MEQDVPFKNPESRRILIIDDDFDFGESLRLILEMKGFGCRLVQSHETALETLPTFDPQVALLDIRLGRYHGSELIPHLLALKPDLQIIMVTAFGSIETAIQTLKNGAYDYLRKPINPDDLLATLNRCYEFLRLKLQKEASDSLLLEKEQQIRASFSQAAVGIGHLSLKGEWQLANEKLCHILGYPWEELRHLTYSELSDADDWSRELKLRSEILDGSRDFYVFEKRFITAERQSLWTKVTLSPVRDGQNEILYFIVFVEDIHQAKTSEKNFRELFVRLAETNQDLEDFTYTASHDLQEPLRKIITFTDRLKVLTGKKLNEKELDYFQRLIATAGRMQQLIEDLLIYSRVAYRYPDFKPLSLNKIVNEVALDLEIAIEDSGAQVDIGKLPDLEGDETQMRQLFQNLIDNAIKFHMTDETPRVTISANKIEDRWTISVKDNGLGIEPHHQERIFKPFERLHNASQYPGSGMGLPICLKIVRRHGGNIQIESRPKEGTTFHITLPEKQNPYQT